MNNFKVTLVGKMKHGLLYEGVKKFGSAAKLAEHLGVSQSTVGTWLNLRKIPKRSLSLDIQKKLMDLLGATVEDLFPEELKSQDFLDKNKDFEITKDMPMDLLIESGLTHKALPSPEEDYFEKEKKEVIADVLKLLSPRERVVIEHRFGLNGKIDRTLEEIGQSFDVTRERIREIEAKALKKLRHPRCSNCLKSFIGEFDDGIVVQDISTVDTPQKSSQPTKKVKIKPITTEKDCLGSNQAVEMKDLVHEGRFLWAKCPVCQKEIMVQNDKRIWLHKADTTEKL